MKSNEGVRVMWVDVRGESHCRSAHARVCCKRHRVHAWTGDACVCVLPSALCAGCDRSLSQALVLHLRHDLQQPTPRLH